MMPTKSYATLSWTATTGRSEPLLSRSRVKYINKFLISVSGDKLTRGIAEIKSREKERQSKPSFLVLFSTILIYLTYYSWQIVMKIVLERTVFWKTKWKRRNEFAENPWQHERTTQNLKNWNL
jgi:hypothetical protein